GRPRPLRPGWRWSHGWGALPAEGAQRLIVEEQVFSHELPSALRVLVEEIPYVRSASVGFWISVGSMHEPEEMAGVCHALEHMLFKGTATRSAEEIARTLDSVGGQLNAFTDKECTCYHAKVLSEHLPLALELLADMLLHSLFRPADVKTEKRVILEEIRQLEDEPDEMADEMFLERLWRGHPLGRPVVGTRRAVRSLTAEKMQAFLRQHYVGNRMVVAVAGNVRHEEVLEQAAALLAEVNRATPEPELGSPSITPFFRRVRKDSEAVHLRVGMPGFSQRHADRYAAAVLDAILGGSTSSRLFQEVREKRGLAYNIGTCAFSFRDAGALTVYAGTSPEKADEVLRLVVAELDRVLQEGVTEREVEQARNQLKGAFLLALDNTDSRMARLAKSQLYHGRVVSVAEVTRSIEAVTLEDVNRVARMVLPEAQRSVLLLGPVARRR
ncbi:MAG: pitrilysin family protein, partial [Armatimonadota bacterium]|nr:pitrilysin family protein [Armatimonadota bacterium]